MKALMAKYPDIKGPDDVTPAVGVANAYDATMLAALAIATAGSTDGDAIRQAFYKIAKLRRASSRSTTSRFRPDRTTR